MRGGGGGGGRADEARDRRDEVGAGEGAMLRVKVVGGNTGGEATTMGDTAAYGWYEEEPPGNEPLNDPGLAAVASKSNMAEPIASVASKSWSMPLAEICRESSWV